MTPQVQPPTFEARLKALTVQKLADPKITTALLALPEMTELLAAARDGDITSILAVHDFPTLLKFREDFRAVNDAMESFSAIWTTATTLAQLDADRAAEKAAAAAAQAQAAAAKLASEQAEAARIAELLAKHAPTASPRLVKP